MKYSIIGVLDTERFSVLHLLCDDENSKISVGTECKIVPLRKEFLPSGLTSLDVVGRIVEVKPYKDKCGVWRDYIKFNERS